MVGISKKQNKKSKNPVSKFFLNNFLNTVVKTTRPLNIENVVDVGCGDGILLARLKKEKIGKDWEGIDNDSGLVELANKVRPNLKITTGDIYKLPFKSNSFDLVVCTEVLERLENPKKAYRELLRVSKKYVLLSVPNEPFFTIQRIGRLKNLLQFGAHPGYINRWTIPGFTKFVKVRDVKIVTRKFPLPRTMIIVKKKTP
jgi:ubiquinone/menaquinone biosynthesis C-methylase UbiE